MHADDESSLDYQYLCYGHREGDVPVSPTTRDAARKRKEKAKRDAEREKKRTYHTQDLRAFMVVKKKK